jgi:hypothetical protein
MSTAPSLEHLYDFETQLASAAAAILADLGFSVHKPGDTAAIPDDHCRVTAICGPADGSQTLVPCGAWSGRVVYHRFSAQLQVTHMMRLSKSQVIDDDYELTSFSSRISRTRVAFDAAAFPFNVANLPWLQVTDIVPSGLNYLANDQRGLVGAQLDFALTFEISSGAWPV